MHDRIVRRRRVLAGGENDFNDNYYLTNTSRRARLSFSQRQCGLLDTEKRRRRRRRRTLLVGKSCRGGTRSRRLRADGNERTRRVERRKMEFCLLCRGVYVTARVSTRRRRSGQGVVGSRTAAPRRV